MVRVNCHPVGTAFDMHGGAGHAWVACYTLSSMVFKADPRAACGRARSGRLVLR